MLKKPEKRQQYIVIVLLALVVFLNGVYTGQLMRTSFAETLSLAGEEQTADHLYRSGHVMPLEHPVCITRENGDLLLAVSEPVKVVRTGRHTARAVTSLIPEVIYSGGLLLAACLICLLFTGEVRSRLIIISYMHRKDGAK